MLLIVTLGSISVNLLKLNDIATLLGLLINPSLSMKIVGTFITFIIMTVIFVPLFLLIARGADFSLTYNRVGMVYFYAYAEIYLVKCIEFFVLSAMSVLVLTNLVNMTFAGTVILGTSITGGFLQIWLFLKTFRIVLEIPYLTIVVAGGIAGGLSLFVLSCLEKVAITI